MTTTLKKFSFKPATAIAPRPRMTPETSGRTITAVTLSERECSRISATRPASVTSTSQGPSPRTIQRISANSGVSPTGPRTPGGSFRS